MRKPPPKSGSSSKKPLSVPPPARRATKAAPVEDDLLPSSDSDDEELPQMQRRAGPGGRSSGLHMSDDRELHANDYDDDDDGDAEGVMDLSDEDDGDEDDEDEEEDDLEAALARGGRVAQLAKQAKALGVKLKLANKEDELGDAVDDDVEEDNQAPGSRKKLKGRGDEEGALWGVNKRAYYDADTAEYEIMDDGEALQEEEAEALRLQRERAAKLSQADYGLSDEEDGQPKGNEGESSSEEDEEEETLGQAAARMAAGEPSTSKPRAQQSSKGSAKTTPNGHAAMASDGAETGVEVETVAKDLTALSREEKMAALMADAPELTSLLQDLTDSLAEVRHRLGPVLREVKDGKLATAEGLSYLEAKHLLLLQYCTNITFYLLLKAEGRPVRDHPVITRLVELRAYLEKIRPIDKQLHYQIEKLLRAAQISATAATASGGEAGDAEDEEAAMAAERAMSGAAAGTRGDDPTRYGPRPEALVPRVPGGASTDLPNGNSGSGLASGADGVYRPPRLNPVSMENDAAAKANGGPSAALSAQERRRLKEAQARAGRSGLVQELAQQLAGAPEELRAQVAGFDSLGAIKARQRLEARSEAEEELFTRVPLTRDEAKRLKAARRAGMAGVGALDDFADEVADLVEASRGAEAGGGEGGRSALADIFARQKVSQKFGGEAVVRAKASGDEDLPRREALGDRRAKFDQAAARRSVAAARRDADEDDDGDAGVEEYDVTGAGGKKRGRGGQTAAGAVGGEEDGFYAEAKASAAARKAARAALHAAPSLAPPLPDERIAGGAPRAISTAIERNRGLTPHRRRDMKNPRKKHRMKYEEALVRRGGQVQKVRQAEGVAYGGEATGIKAKVSKSKKLG